MLSRFVWRAFHVRW